LKILKHQLSKQLGPLLDFILVTRSACTKASTRVPTQITCQTFKQHSARWELEGCAFRRSVRAFAGLHSYECLPSERGRQYSHGLHSVNFL